MASRKVIVFGPTGGVGSATAKTAAKLGAHVALAMRDTSKSIPGLDTQGKQGSFEKIAADLTKPDTVAAAVTKTGAKYAFVYLAWGTNDHMKATFEALKSAGIVQVVFLSSFSVESTAGRSAIPPSEVIPYQHAQVELAIEAVSFPEGYVAIRPGSFATNVHRYASSLKSGVVPVHVPEGKVDHIVPEDIGKVAGTILAKGPQDDQEAIYLLGPKLITNRETVELIVKATGQNITIKQADDEDARKLYLAQGAPPPLVDYLIKAMSKRTQGVEMQIGGVPVEPEWMTNVEKYSGEKATGFEEWLKQNNEMFTS